MARYERPLLLCTPALAVAAERHVVESRNTRQRPGPVAQASAPAPVPRARAVVGPFRGAANLKTERRGRRRAAAAPTAGRAPRAALRPA